MKVKYLSAFVLALGVMACQKETQKLETPEQTFTGDIKEMKVPDGFAYQTTTKAKVAIDVRDLQGGPLKGVKVGFFTADPVEGGQEFARAFTDESGKVNSEIGIPAFVEKVFVQVYYPGFANTAEVNPSSNIKLDFGGVQAGHGKGKGAAVVQKNITKIKGNYYYMGGFNSAGLPNYLEPQGDVLTSEFLSDVNASFPESRPVPTHNPEYLATGRQLDVKLVKKSDVWVTFVTEGAGHKNVLAYYVYDTDNPPATRSAIDSIFVVFPNASLPGSGGNLNAGDKVKLGTFEAGKSISWALISDGWTGSKVDVDETTYFSTTSLNTNESDPSKRQHSVQLVDGARELLLNGFEDLPRSGGLSDEDFNDLMFYVTANPWSAVDTSGTPPTVVSKDRDNDNVPDDVDDYPNDPSKAYTNDYTGTLAYEDLWPHQADYDFNDMVIDYNVRHVANAQNEVVNIESDWTVRAVGASFKNGFGFQFDNVAPSAVSSITGQNLEQGIVSTNSNGTESGQSKATVIAFDNVFNVLPNPGTPFINTVKGEATAAPQTLTIDVDFNNPQNAADVGVPPYNNFIFIDETRGREVHLADMEPTDLADLSLLGSSNDDSDPASGKYYKNANNLPWGLHIQSGFDYPVEYSPITDAYNNFAPWAMSSGNQFTDWYTDAAGNRNEANIYYNIPGYID